ncbi:FAD-dependent oxidoreductase [Streptomyces sp. NPDC059441]|uniref:FAD-dependent oxidoreductase n=1 Tax=Streptomyces sp. NPDC059441 TaxID=3346829 RepID=UPI00369C8036
MTASTTAPPRIAVLGGGVGGLATAGFLRRAGLPSTVYEQAPRLTEVGAGVLVAPNAARQLRRLKVLDVFRERAVRLDTGWEFRRWQDGTVLSSEDLSAACERLYGEHTYTAHRADLLTALIYHPCRTTASGTVTNVSAWTTRARRCGSTSPTGDRPRPMS